MLNLNSGPNVTTGNTNPSQMYETDMAPNVDAQGSAYLDPRYVGVIGAAPGTRIPAIFGNPYFCAVDAVPTAVSATRIAAAANVTNGTAMTLVSAQGTGVSCNMPLVPMGSAMNSANVVKVLTLDFGFTTANTTSGSNSITIPSGAWKFFRAGQKIVISGAGTSANNPLITTVSATPAANATTVTINDNAGQTVSNAQVGTADATGTAMFPYTMQGALYLMDPTQNISRSVSVTGSASATGGAFKVSGYDIFGVAMNETITVGAGAVTAYGKKCFKHIVSVTPQFTDAHNYSIGTGDCFGFAIRSDFWEYMNVFWNGAFLTASTGWTVADTNTATATTGDVRGSMSVGTSNNAGTGATGASDGTKRLAVFMSLPMYNAINANNLNYVTLFGNTQF